jgi:GTPase SAR1 family protein
MVSASKPIKSGKVATTRSTAGPGFAFEDLVAADLLTRFILDMPILGIEVSGREVLSQAGALGWAIDDLVCVGTGPDGVARHLAVSCKSNVQVTASGWPQDFIEAAWTLWRAQLPFNRSTDHIGLVTRGRNAAFDAIWSDLKTWCDDADPALAMGRINASQKHRKIFDSVHENGKENGCSTDEADTLAFIAKLHLYPVDFQLSPSSNLEQAKQRCRTALTSDTQADGAALWETLVQTAETARLGNGIIRLPRLLSDLSSRFGLKPHPSISTSWLSLGILSSDQRATIEVVLPNGHVVDRRKEMAGLSQLLRASRACIVIGESGVGKSALVARFLDQDFADATQVWLGPDVLRSALSAAGRSAIGLDQELSLVLDRSLGDDKILILDSLERLEGAILGQLSALLSLLATNSAWRVVLITQSGFENQLRATASLADAPVQAVPALSAIAIQAGLRSVPQLAWIANDPAILPLFANLKTLSWVATAESSFREEASDAPTSTAEIADRLWSRWTSGAATTQLQRFLIQLAVRDAAFERSFAISDLAAGDLAAFDQRSNELPLQVNARNRVEFTHDLASDWARYQRLKEIVDDVEQWAALAPQPLWIPALRLLGQFLLSQPDQARHGWDYAFQQLTAAGNVEASDILLDALCLDARLDHHLEDRLELIFANDAALFKRLLHRFLHVATVPSIPRHIAVESVLRIYLEADMRFPILERWGPMGRFLHAHAQRVGALGAPIVARVCKTWLGSLPTMLGDQPTPLRDVMVTVALETARTEQIISTARYFHGGGDNGKLIFGTALLGAPDLPVEVAAFALEMAQRRPMAEATLARVDGLRAADRAERIARQKANPPRRRAPPPSSFISNRQELPPWPLGPNARLIDAFRDAVLHANGLLPLMNTDTSTATEVLLACMIEDQPHTEFDHSLRIDESYGLKFDHESYPTVFWKSPFFTYLSAQPEAALRALKQLLDFVVGRWFSQAPQDAEMPLLTVQISESVTRTFPGTWAHFGWSQHNSTSSGQLYCALDALERWLLLKVDAGEDIGPWCERLFDLEASTAILGVLVNVGKHHPVLFLGPLRPLIGLEDLYWWDHGRVENVGFNFDSFFWYRQGDKVFNMARDGVLAPHRKVEMRTVVGNLAAQNPDFAADLAFQTTSWNAPKGEKDRLEQRILLSEFDPANRQQFVDEATGEKTSQVIYPKDLQAEMMAYQVSANAKLQPLTLPYQCRKILAQDGALAGPDCEYLAGLLPEQIDDGVLTEEKSRTMVTAAAATLLARGGEWLKADGLAKARALSIIRHIIETADGDQRDRLSGDEALSFAAIGAFSEALQTDKPDEWNAALVHILSSRDPGAINTLMATAYRHREQIGSAWYRLNFVLLLVAALDRLIPRYDEDDRTAIWQHWLARLRLQPIFGIDATITVVDPANVARRAERLLERRRARRHPDRTARLSGKARRFVGLSSHILEAGYAWLLDHENDSSLALDPENHRLLDDLWAFEAWRMEGERDGNAEEQGDDDEEYDLPSGLGYAILRIAPTFVMARASADAKPLWQAILAIGPNGYHVTEQFAAGWFLLPFKPQNTDRFMAIWRAMLDAAFAADWSSGRRWYRGHQMIVKLLGLHSHAALSQANAIRARLPELVEYYRRWAQSDMARDEDDLGAFCHFLTTEAGRHMRLEGVCWVRDAMNTSDRFYRTGTANSVAELVDCVLVQNGDDLLRQQAVRDAVIDIVARLVASEVPTAMGMQARLAALK